ncbi:MAG TPA: MG2 domain-containing protein, partial [Roseiflexaceae bacterium]|nr:MG2 domain-containing protein [Roseiflexaceae bacterium]
QPQIDFLDFGRLAPGTYYLEIGAGGSGALPAIIDRQLLLVTQVALTMKRSSDELFFWAVDLQSGAPVRGLSLSATAYNYSLGGFDPPVSLGSTDADGVLRAAYTPNELYTTIYAWSNDPAQPVLISSDWGSGIGPWDFGLPGDLYKREVAGSIITDRPIYRPGHTVQLRGVLRLDDDGRYTLPAAADRTSVQVIDIDGNAIYSNTMTLSAFGSFNLSLPLAQGAPLGSYSVMAQLLRGGDPLGQPIYGSFIVSEYRRPVFEVTVTPATTDLLQGDALVATIASSYFAGGAPRNAPVRWRLLAQDLFFSAEAAPNFSVGRFDDADAWYRWDPPPFAGGELIGDGEGTTDAQGRFVLRLPAERYTPAGQAIRSRILTIDVEVTDIDGQVIAAQGIVNLHEGAFYIGMRPDGYVATAGHRQAIDLITLDPQGNPIGNRSINATLFAREWYSIREQGADGRLYWTSRYTDTLIERTDLTTDAGGRGRVEFT